MVRTIVLLSFFLLATVVAQPALAEPPGPRLLVRNTEVPFCYQCGGERTWPILSAPLAANEEVVLTLLRSGEKLSEGKSGSVEAEGLKISLTRDGKLSVVSTSQASAPVLELRITVRRVGAAPEEQVLTIRPAPPTRPVSYYADFADDLINIFGLGVISNRQFFHHELSSPPTGKSRYRVPHRDSDLNLLIDKSGFDQYFRRLQCQGISRLIVWPLPFPFLADPSGYEKEDWDRFKAIARAALESQELKDILVRNGSDKTGIVTWAWIRDTIGLRLNPEIQKIFGDSAREHGIALALSFRPLEPAVTKYYEVPVFDHDGSFFLNYLPFASPHVNFHFNTIGYANYREVLASMGFEDEAGVGTIRIPQAGNIDAFLQRFQASRDNLRIIAADFPPMQSDSLVFQRRRDGSFQLRRFGDLSRQAYSKRRSVTGFSIKRDGNDLLITGLRIPRQYRYILLENPSGKASLEMSSFKPVLLFSKKSTPLGRLQTYWAFDETTPERKKTLVAGIPEDGGYHSTFFASEASATYLASQPRSTLEGCTLVIDRGDAYSPEMIDYNQPEARAFAIKEIASIVRHPAFDEIYLNTRSHTQLAGSMADGEDGIQPKVEYQAAKKPARHLGLDLAYAPRLAISDPELRRLASSEATLEKLTMWQPGEWAGSCQSPDCDSRWRYVRNLGVASGVRLLLLDLSRRFPDKRLRVVLPERSAVVEAVESVRANLPREAVHYAGSRNNWIQNIGEGMSMVDLTDLEVEPVLLGVGPFVNITILEAYLTHALSDLAANNGSKYKGPKGIMYEGQWTLRGQLTAYRPAGWTPEGKKAREERMCAMLKREDISEVILYEAADWTYSLSLDDPFSFLDECLSDRKASSR